MFIPNIIKICLNGLQTLTATKLKDLSEIAKNEISNEKHKELPSLTWIGFAIILHLAF